MPVTLDKFVALGDLERSSVFLQLQEKRKERQVNIKTCEPRGIAANKKIESEGEHNRGMNFIRSSVL